MRVFLFLIFLVTSCVSKNQYAKLEETYKKNVGTVEKLNKQIAQLKDKQKSIKDSIQRICNEINIYKDSFDIVKTYLTENVEKLFEKVELKHKNLYTALREHYLSYEEKEVFYWINLARTQPQYYCKMYVEPLAKKYSDNFYYTSLYETMMEMQPVGILYPNRYLHYAALCHAVTHGEKGYIGHERTKECKNYTFHGECCAYGYLINGFDVVLGLLVDENVPSLGHREICLSDRYSLLGASVAFHNSDYKINWVLDFGIKK